jgi:alkanesulfonate monooxygenase SsuD/methylene tetrahydromethanopterin reductase-like flavin-dependent oxidoreductase (luciferase family)
MDIGIALPTMCRGYSRATTLNWCRLADQGPFSSISSGERLTFHNPELWTTMSAAAALTKRLRILVNLSILPANPPALVAKQTATLDVLSDGRVTLGVGVGGREHDYRALGTGFERRHTKLDEGVATLRSLWSGQPLFDGADPVGPACVQLGGPPILAGAIGPKALARAARWADGVTGFSLSGAPDELSAAARAAHQAWDANSRSDPRLVSGTFYVLGVPEPDHTLRAFVTEYLSIFSRPGAESIARAMTTFTPDAINRTLDGAEEAGLDEFILTPGSTDLKVLEATIELIDKRG